MRTLKFFLIALVVFALVLVPALVVLADEGAPPGPPDVAGIPSSPLANLIAMASGVILSLVFSYIPGLSHWYGDLAPDLKRAIMALALIVVTAGIYGLNCWGVISVDLGCNADGALQAVTALFLALAANQATHQISPKFLRFLR